VHSRHPGPGHESDAGPRCRARADDFLELAEAGGVEFIVADDGRLAPFEPFEGTAIADLARLSTARQSR
jgi:hypothetical protein